LQDGGKNNSKNNFLCVIIKTKGINMTVEENFLHRVGEMGGRLRVKSALNPVLWLCLIVTIPTLVIISRQENPPLWLIFIAIAPVGCAVIGFFFLLIFDRDKLQSEDYQIRKKTLDIIREKGDKFPVLAASIQAIANPDLKKLPIHKKGESNG